MDDDEVVGFWSGLGLPGLVDVHTHFMPDAVMRKVWAYFDAAGPLVGREWPIRYRWPQEQRLEHLRALGVRAFPSLVYPHKPDMAAWLNDWAQGFAGEHPEVLMTATMFPEPSAAEYVQRAVTAGVAVMKVHVQVGGFDPGDELLDVAWGLLAEAGVPVVLHAGSGPAAGAFTGPEPVEALLRRHPRLRLVMAHMGMPDYEAFVSMAERYDGVMLDTTMCFTEFTGSAALGPVLAPRLRALEDKVLLGTDFPNIPYAYAHQLEVLARLDLGDEWLRAVCWGNGAMLFGVTADVGRLEAAPQHDPTRG